MSQSTEPISEPYKYLRPAHHTHGLKQLSELVVHEPRRPLLLTICLAKFGQILYSIGIIEATTSYKRILKGWAGRDGQSSIFVHKIATLSMT